MQSPRAALGALLFAVAASVGLAHAAPQGTAEAAPRPWRVVLIRNWDSMYPVNVMREQALRNALVEDAPRAVEIYPEEIDPLRFPGSSDVDLAGLLQRKYEATPVDLVIATGMESLDFASQHRDFIWPGVPIVFNGVIEGQLADWRRPPRTAGVTMTLDVRGAVDVGLALVPNARRLYLVSGASPFDQMLLRLAQNALQGYDRPLEVRYLTGLTQDEILARVAQVEPDSLILYLTVLRDRDGRISGPGNDLMSRVAARATAPMISATHTQFRRGAVAGSSARFDEHGRIAGQLARRVLTGANPDHFPIQAEPEPYCEVDWTKLQRWSIAERNVPSRCSLFGKPEPAWERYLWPLVALLAIILLQAALIWALAMQSARRRRAETLLAARSTEMAQVARMSMVGALTAGIAHEINQPMGAILSNAEAAEMMLEQGTLDSDKLREILADIRNEDLRASEVIRGLRRLLARSEWRPLPLELNAEVAEALRHVAYDAARRGVKLAPVFDPTVPVVSGDSVQLQQVVINLAMNAMDAVSAEPEMRREIRIETRPRSNGAEIVVTDRGPGVPPDLAARLFEGFTTKNDGMGFGLSIVRTILDLHRGRISFESNVPQGAIFRVWLPAIGT